MNYSESMKRREQRREQAYKRFRRIFLVALLMGAIFGFILGRVTAALADVVEAATMPPVETETITAMIPDAHAPPMPEPTPEPIPEPEPTPLGTFRVTAYCPCEKCCGVWALNRPNGIVYGAAGIELKAGVSAASPLPFGTVVEVEGLGEYTVQDRTAQWVVEKFGENLIDIYCDTHEEAEAIGLQYLNVYLKEDEKSDPM